MSDMESAEAGALWGLYFALYHSDWHWLLTMPDPVCRAYIEVQRITEAARDGSELQAVMAATAVDPIKYVPTDRP